MVYKLRSHNPDGYATRSSKRDTSTRKSRNFDANNNSNTNRNYNIETASKNKSFCENRGYAFRKQTNEDVLIDTDDTLQLPSATPMGVIRPIPRKCNSKSSNAYKNNNKSTGRRNRIRSIDDILDNNPISPIYPRQALNNEVEQINNSFVVDSDLDKKSVVSIHPRQALVRKENSLVGDNFLDKKPVLSIHPRQTLLNKGRKTRHKKPNKENLYEEGERIFLHISSLFLLLLLLSKEREREGGAQVGRA